MELNPFVLRSRQTSTAKANRRHSKISSVLLHKEISRGFGCSEQAVLCLINRELLIDSHALERSFKIPALIFFCYR